MKRIILLLSLSVSFFLPAQRKKPVAKTPAFTEASQRWEGYLQRLSLEKNSLVSNVSFRNVGPTVMSGRVVDLAVNPENPSHFYAAFASGSLWETKNSGASFTPLFDNQVVMTIGDIAVDWKNEIIYVGTGENNSSRSSYAGYGIFKSADNGATWEHLGLEETQHTGRILLHPDDPNTLWVAALGHLYSENKERGIYKSTNGGKTWKKTLFVDNRTGIVDLILHPANPDLLIAAAWEKDRKAWNFTESGTGTALYRSEDGGESWSAIADDSGFPDTKGTGRIGLSFAPSDPAIVYAVLDNQDRRAKEDKEEAEALTKDMLRAMAPAPFLALENSDINAFLDANNFPAQHNAVDIKKEVSEGTITPQDLVTFVEDANAMLFDTPVKGGEMYRSDDAGKTWQKTHEGYIENMIYSYGYYFGQVRVDPQDPNVIYTMGVPIIRSEDGGKTFASINEDNVHVDHHALWINPQNPAHLILGNDGGVYVSLDTGATWTNCNSPSVGQFYAVSVDMDEPYHVYGGLQDNGVWKGPSTYDYSRRWYQEGKYPYERLMGGDGMQVAIDTRDNEVVYTGYQFGNYFRIHTKTGQRKYITPKHELGEEPFRWNWESPILLSSHNQDIVYFGSNRFHRSMNRGDDFETLSPDLTAGGLKGDVSYGTLTSISESPMRFGLIYVGSDDGLIHVSKDAGASWLNVSKGLPERFWVSSVTASAHKEGRIYATLNGYRWDHFEAMVYLSEDYGASWTPIHAGLPKEPVNVLKEDPKNENILYVGTDHGVYASLDKGASYHAFVEGLPNVPVHDLVVHPREQDLVLGTHGRGIYIANLQEIQQLTPEILAKEIHLFAPEKVNYSERWGSRWSEWVDYNEPEVKISFFCSMASTGTLEIWKEDQKVAENSIAANRGLNFKNVSLATTEAFGETLDKEEKESFKASDNGKYYLTAGDYVIRVTLNTVTQETSLTITAPKAGTKRKE